MNPIVQFYLAASLIFGIIDEKNNLDNPKYPTSDRRYILCNWEEEDFYPIEVMGGPLLRVSKESDSKIKAKARRRYWERNVETEE
tara:strand:+ start:11931 stop:12185 length:255 start_codon:yes stop_codon:yes gene_type:complete